MLSDGEIHEEYSLWAKDIVFVLSDGHLEGMNAWLSAYHGDVQSSGYCKRKSSQIQLTLLMARSIDGILKPVIWYHLDCPQS